MALVDPFEGYRSDATITRGHLWYGLSHGPATIMTIAITMALIAMALVVMTLTLGPGILDIWVTPALLSEMARLSKVVASGS